MSGVLGRTSADLSDSRTRLAASRNARAAFGRPRAATKHIGGLVDVIRGEPSFQPNGSKLMKFAGLSMDPKRGLADEIRGLERRPQARAGRRFFGRMGEGEAYLVQTIMKFAGLNVDPKQELAA